MNDESRLHSPDALNTATPRKHLPEDTGRTLGPGHLDMVHERIDQAIGIAQTLYAVIANPNNLPAGAEQAAWGQERLLEEAVEHLNEYTRDRAEQARQPVSFESKPPPAGRAGIDFNLVEDLTSAVIARIAGAHLLIEDRLLGEHGAGDALHAVLDDVQAKVLRVKKHAAEVERQAARQPVHQNAIDAAVVRLKRLEEVIANDAPEKEDLQLLENAIALLEGRRQGLAA